MTFRRQSVAGWVLPFAAAGFSAGSAWAADPAAPVAPAEPSSGSFSRVTQVGDVTSVTTPSDARIHVYGGTGIDTGDYTRGGFDGVREGRFGDNELSYRLDLGVAFELIDNPGAPLSNLTLSGGTGNGFSNSPVATIGDEVWYESNNYVGLSAEFGGAFLAGLSLYEFGSPDIPGVDPIEVAGALKYTGDDVIGSLSPQIKVAQRTRPGDSTFVQAQLAPSFDIAEVEAGAVSLSLPLVLGVGFNDYYGPGTDEAVYGSVGASLAVPLSIPSDFGSWTFTAGATLIVRDEDIAAAGQPIDDADETVGLGSIGLSFAY